MPIPKPTKGEDKNTFIDRCMGDDVMKKEYPDNDQRLAICETEWKNKRAEASPFIERRYIPAETEFRFDEKRNKLQGYGVIFNEWANIGGFKERVSPGTFTRSIKNNDIRALYNHEANYVLGRSKAKPAPTLRLSEDSHGIEFDIDLPDTTFAKDLRVSIDRGDVSQCSFSFNVVRGGEVWEKNYTERTLTEAKMFDIGPVTFAAYEKTEVKLRSAIIDLGIDYNELNLIIVKANRGIELTEEESRTLKSTIETLQKYVPQENVPLVNEHTPSADPDQTTRMTKLADRKIQIMRMKLGGF